jgi:hypothetical protein
MRHAILLMLICSVMHAISAAQSVPEMACPSIDVIVPAGIVEPGRLETYTAAVSGANQDLKYFWKVNAGEVKSGQGTRTIEVQRADSRLTVTVDIEGLPGGCPSSASDSSVLEYAPQPAKVGTLYSLEKGNSKKKLQEFADEIAKYPDNQAYIIFGSGANTSSSDVESRERKLLEYLTKLMNPFDRSRFTLVRSGGKADVIELWRIPPGADNPACEECSVSACPEIKVVGPAGKIPPGDTIVFAANPPLNDFEKLNYNWTVSAGTILEGQGKPWIIVQTTRELNRTKLSATVVIKGAAADCAPKASGFAVIDGGGDPINLGQITEISAPKIRRELDEIVREFRKYSGYYLYFVLYSVDGETRTSVARRERFINTYLHFTHKIPRSNIVFLQGGVGNHFGWAYAAPITPPSKSSIDN